MFFELHKIPNKKKIKEELFVVKNPPELLKGKNSEISNTKIENIKSFSLIVKFL